MHRTPDSNVRRPKIRLIAAGVLALAAAGCQQDMHNQPKFVSQRESSFFANGRTVGFEVRDSRERATPSLDEKQWGIIHPSSADPVAPQAEEAFRSAPEQVADNAPPPAPTNEPTQPVESVQKAAGSGSGSAGKSSSGAGDAAKGKALYGTNCTMCHQATRAGMPPMIPSLVGVTSRLTAAQIREIINTGKTGTAMAMPPFGDKLSKQDVDDLIAYLKSEK